MKTRYFLLLVVAIMSEALKAQEASLTIVPDPETKEVRYWPLDGKSIPFYDQGTLATLQPDSSYHIHAVVQEPVVLNFITGNQVLFRTYLTPGSKDTVFIRKKKVEFSGLNLPYNQYLQISYEAEDYCEQFVYFRHELEKLNTLEEYNRKVNEKQSVCRTALQDKKLSPEFVRCQTTLLDCMFTHLFYRKTLSLRNKNLLSEAWIQELTRQNRFNLQNEEALRYCHYKDLVNLQVMNTCFILEKQAPESVDPEKRTVFLFNEYSKRITGKYLEHALACLLYDDIIQNDFSQDVPDLYASFCSLYPQSTYRKALEPGVEKIRRFHAKAPETTEITILPGDSTLKTIEDAVKQFKGKVIYIDLWATWCSPCQKMFAFGDALKKATEKMDIVYLYISIDKPEARDKWEKMIHFYQLKGFHILAGKELAKSFYTSLGNTGNLAIPQFIIVGKDGKVAVERAAEPNDPEQVIKELKEAAQ